MSSVFTFDEFELDLNRQELRRTGTAIKVHGLLLRLLEVFVRSPQHVISREELAAKVWDGRAVSENALAVAITRLRKILGHERGVRDVVLNSHGRGYRFLPAVYERAAAGAEAFGSTAHAPFVGRERIIGQLSSALIEAVGGRGGAILLTGEQGIGKTRVAETLAREAAVEHVRVAWVHCRELGDTPPLRPFAAILHTVLGPFPRENRADGLRSAAAIPEVSRVEKHQLFEAVMRTLSLASAREPYLLILDDLHRADPAALELLHYTLSGLPRLRILLLGTVRDGAADPRLMRVLNHRNCRRIALQPLSEAQVTSYVAAFFGDDDPALARAVFEKSEGNPLLMSELTCQLRENEPPDGSRLTTPSFAAELANQRITDLDAAARHALGCAAVNGRSFSLPLLRAITGRPAADLMSSLDQAIARVIVAPARDAPTEFVFTRELLRAALYDALDPAHRRACHWRVAQALEPRVARGEVPHADLASHARAALPEGDLCKTVDYCIDAFNAALRVCAVVDAARYLQYAREALELMTEPSGRFRFTLLWRQAALVRGFSTREFRPLAQQLLQLAREQSSGIALARAAWLIDPLPGFPRTAGSLEALTEALAMLPAGEPTMRAALMARLATCVPLAYDAAGSTAQFERAFEAAHESAELGDAMTVRFTQLYLFGGPAHRVRATEALRWLKDVLGTDTSSFAMPLALLDMHRALIALQGGDLATMTRALDRAEARCRELDLELLWHVERFRAFASINAGHDSEGRAVLLKLHKRAVRSEPCGSSVFCAYDRSVVLARAEARGCSWERALARDAEDPPNIWALKLRALVAAGAKEEAHSALASVPPDALRCLPCDREYLGTLGALTRVALALRTSDYARVLYELLTPYPEYFAANLAFLCEGSVSQLLGMLARSFGERGTARQHLRFAVAASKQAGLAACAADARRELAKC